MLNNYDNMFPYLLSVHSLLQFADVDDYEFITNFNKCVNHYPQKDMYIIIKGYHPSLRALVFYTFWVCF